MSIKTMKEVEYWLNSVVYLSDENTAMRVAAKKQRDNLRKAIEQEEKAAEFFQKAKVWKK